jgi:ribosomal protein S18 acetylase RimI-like enzyme
LHLTIKEISTEETYPLRHRILRAGRPLEDCVLPGDDEPTTYHLAAMDGERIVSIGSFYEAGHPEIPGERLFQLRGMATDEGYRRRQLGTLLLERGMEIARERGGDVLWCNARSNVAGFYLSQGFTQVGEEFDIPTVGPHLRMFKRL